jgi:hypothetical protein
MKIFIICIVHKIVRMIKTNRRQALHVARMGELRNAYKILAEEPEGKRPLERPRCRWEGDIKMDLREIEMGSSG